ncbi:MAG: hypothetical protein ACLS4Z_03480 [Christensenellaceae bacterium]
MVMLSVLRRASIRHCDRRHPKRLEMAKKLGATVINFREHLSRARQAGEAAANGVEARFCLPVHGRSAAAGHLRIYPRRRAAKWASSSQRE